MRRLTVSIIDVLGVFVPGFLLLSGFGLLAVAFDPHLLEKLRATSETVKLPAIWVIVGLLAYVLGFLLRLVSIRLLQALTGSRWRRMVSDYSASVGGELRASLADKQLVEALEESTAMLGETHLYRIAPLFPYAKRLVRPYDSLREEAERLEAEVRFTAGLFPPLVLLAIASGSLAYRLSLTWLLPATIALAFSVVVFLAFPDRRVKEVLYVYYLALVALKSPPGVPQPQAD